MAKIAEAGVRGFLPLLDLPAETQTRMLDRNACNAYTLQMSTNLTIRNLGEPVKQKLRVRAAEHQRSMEAEVRAILSQAVEEVPAQEGPLGSARGLWKGRQSTDEIMKLTRGEN